MKTITERDGKNVNMQVVGDLHKYPDGSVHTVKEGKAVWEEGSGGSGGGGALVVTVAPAENGANSGGTKKGSGGDEPIYVADKTVAEIKAGLLAGNVVIQFVDNEFFSANNVYAVAFVEWKDKDSSWAVGALGLSTSVLLRASNLDDYPQLEI